MNIYAGNLSYQTNESDLREAFEAFGAVSSSAVIKDRETGQSKGFGFVEMPNNAEADAAIKALNGRAINGRNIKVNQAEPRKTLPLSLSYDHRVINGADAGAFLTWLVGVLADLRKLVL